MCLVPSLGGAAASIRDRKGRNGAGATESGTSSGLTPGRSALVIRFSANGDSHRVRGHTARMRPGGDETNGDPVEAMHDTEAESGDEEGLQDTFDMDQREARELGVNLDPVAPTETELD